MGAKKRKTSNTKCTNIHKHGPEIHKMRANVCVGILAKHKKHEENALKKWRAFPPKNKIKKSRKTGRV